MTCHSHYQMFSRFFHDLNPKASLIRHRQTWNMKINRINEMCHCLIKSHSCPTYRFYSNVTNITSKWLNVFSEEHSSHSVDYGEQYRPCTGVYRCVQCTCTPPGCQGGGAEWRLLYITFIVMDIIMNVWEIRAFSNIDFVTIFTYKLLERHIHEVLTPLVTITLRTKNTFVVCWGGQWGQWGWGRFTAATSPPSCRTTLTAPPYTGWDTSETLGTSPDN